MGRSIEKRLERHIRAMSWKISHAGLDSLSSSHRVPLNVLESGRGPEEGSVRRETHGFESG